MAVDLELFGTTSNQVKFTPEKGLRMYQLKCNDKTNKDESISQNHS